MLSSMTSRKKKRKESTHVVLPLSSGQKGYGSVAITDGRLISEKKHLTAWQVRKQNQGTSI
jgi:hypothetical protein